MVRQRHRVAGVGVTPVITQEERVWHGKFANAQMNCTSWLKS